MPQKAASMGSHQQNRYQVNGVQANRSFAMVVISRFSGTSYHITSKRAFEYGHEDLIHIDSTLFQVAALGTKPAVSPSTNME